MFKLSEFFANFYKNQKIVNNYSVTKKLIVDNIEEVEGLWGIYNNSFLLVNRRAPCKQSFSEESFADILKDPTAIKYIAVNENDKKLAGMGIITNNFKNTPWISEEYFEYQFPGFYSKRLMYYFIGIVVSERYRKQRCASRIINKIIGDLPEGAAVGFDHSYKVNPLMPYIVKKINDCRNIKRKYLDSQNYYIFYKK